MCANKHHCSFFEQGVMEYSYLGEKGGTWMMFKYWKSKDQGVQPMLLPART
jgi:hypothetical protein